MKKLHLYDQSKGKAYSYFGTIAKRYLIIYNNNNYKKLQERADVEEIDEDKNIMYETVREAEEQADPNTFIDQYIRYIDKHLSTLFPKSQDAKTADAIIELFRKRETLEIFNKKALYIYIREMTDTTTPQITKVTKKLDILRTRLYNEYYSARIYKDLRTYIYYQTRFMANFDDITLFGSTSLSDIFKQIHRNNKDTDKQINDLIDTLKPLASSNAGSAVMLMPTVKDLIDVNVKITNN